MAEQILGFSGSDAPGIIFGAGNEPVARLGVLPKSDCHCLLLLSSVIVML